MRIEGTLEKEIELKTPIMVAGKPYTSVTIRETVGLDAEALSAGANAKKKGAQENMLVHRCIAEVPGADRLPTLKEIREAPFFIVDEILDEIQVLSAGENIDVAAPCQNPKCGKPIEMTVSIFDFKEISGHRKPVVLNLSRGFRKDGKVLKKCSMRLMDNFDREELQDGRTPEELSRDLSISKFLADHIVDIEGVKVTEEDVSTMASADRKDMLKELLKVPHREVLLKERCPHCDAPFLAMRGRLDFLA